MTDESHSASAAREVLKRAEYMLSELRADPEGIEWETKFSAAVALLRSVGHVLHEVDMEKNSLRQAIDNHWTALKEGKANKKPEIFWEFIYGERNLILKKGELRTGPISDGPNRWCASNGTCRWASPASTPAATIAHSDP
jgi:hypothetical protein